MERYHRNLEYECLLLEQPTDLQSTWEINPRYAKHYNFERPNQAITCQNQPPRVAFPQLPELPSLPEQVDPDSWLLKIHGQHYKRRINSNGQVQIGKQRYYIRKNLAGRYVVLRVDAHKHQFEVLMDQEIIKQLPMKGLQNQELPFQKYLELISQEALSEWKSWRYSHTPRYG